MLNRHIKAASINLAYILSCLMCVWFNARPARLFTIPILAGELTFPVSVLLLYFATSYSPLKKMINTVMLAAVLNMAFIGYCSLLMVLPAPPFSATTQIFNQFLQWAQPMYLQSVGILFLLHIVIIPIFYRVQCGALKYPIVACTFLVATLIFDGVCVQMMKVYECSPMLFYHRFIIVALVNVISGITLIMAHQRFVRKKENIYE